MPAQPTLTLLAYIFVMMPGMLLGYYFARTKRFQPHHKLTMTTVTVVNWVLILLLMAGSYVNGVLPNLPSRLLDPTYLLPTLHLITGTISQLMATYLVLLMWTENTPLSGIVLYRIRNIKTPMRITLVLWLTTIALGVAIFAVWYAAIPASGQSSAPVATEEAIPAATEEATSEVTPDATEAATADAVPAVTEEVSPTATEEPEPTATEEARAAATVALRPATTEEVLPLATEEDDSGRGRGRGRGGDNDEDDNDDN